MRMATLTLALTSAVLFSGCASILNEQTQQINISGSGGKSVAGSVDGKTFTSSGIVAVTRQNKPLTLQVTTAGCTKETLLQNSVDPKFFINILSGGVFGSSTDFYTERMWKYDDNIIVSCT